MAALPVESSWRMVEGEHDSFDTSIVPNAFSLSGEYGDDGDDPFVSTSGAPSQQSGSAGAATTSSRRGLGNRTVSGASAMSALSSVSRGGGGGGGASSSWEDRISLGGESFGGSVVGSQDDDIHSFLRKAENDERVLLRSPFQPSLPSSVRQSPMSASSAGKASKTAVTAGSSRLDRTTFQTPEPEFRMPTIDMDGSLHAGDGHPQNQRVAGISSSFRVSDTGSPAQRRRTGGGLLSRLNGRQTMTENGTGSTSSENGPSTATAAWRRTVPSSRTLFFVLLPLLGLVAAYGTPLFYSTTTTTTNTVCSLPGVRYIRLPFCPPTTYPNNKTTTPAQDDNTNAGTVEDTNYWAVRNRFNFEARQAAIEKPAPPTVKPVVSLVRNAGQLMRVQTQLAGVVKDRVLVQRSKNKNNVPPAQDAWLVPRAQTKDLRLAAQIQSGQAKQESKSQNSATLLLVELDAYLDAAKHISIALTRLQTGAAATAADTLAYRSRQTLAQLRRIATREGGSSNDEGSGWLSRIFSSASSTRRAQLRDTYRHHVDTVLAKTQLRVTEAEAVFRALEVAGQHLAGVQQYVVARKLELIGKNIEQEATGSTSSSTSVSSASTGGGPGSDPFLDTSGGLFSWLWSVVFGRQPEDLHSLSTAKMSKAARAWSGYADQLQRLYDDHETAVGRAAETLDDISAVRDALSVLQTHLDEDSVDDASSNDEGDLDMRLHMDIVDAGIQDLEKVGR